MECSKEATSTVKLIRINTKKYINIDTDEKLDNLVAKIKNNH